MAIYQTEGGAGFDPNQVFFLDIAGSPEYPALPFAPGTLGRGTDGTDWVYCQSSVAITAGNAVLIGTPFSSVNGVVNAQEFLAAPVTAGTIASAPFGQLIGIVGGTTGSVSVAALSGTQTVAGVWVQRAGNCPNITFPTGGSAAGATGTTLSQLHTYSLAAGGSGSLVSSAGGSGTSYQVNGIVFTNAAASTAGPNTGVLNYPTAGLTN